MIFFSDELVHFPPYNTYLHWTLTRTIFSSSHFKIIYIHYQSNYNFYNEYIVHTLHIPLLHFQVPRLCLPWYSSDDCQLFPFGTDGGSLETPTPDGSPWGPHLSSGSFDRMCRQTGTPVTFRLITWCAMSHTGKVISTSTTHKSTQNFQYIVHSHMYRVFKMDWGYFRAKYCKSVSSINIWKENVSHQRQRHISSSLKCP